MTDRELLEVAARAAWIGELVTINGMVARYYGNEHVPYVPWNPLTDDGDALREAGL